MSYWYFMSYARFDKSQLLIKFHQDLCEQVLLQEYMPPEDAGFFDGDAIKLGDPWKQDLATALGTSRVLVGLCSPAYSNSEYCGKEFQIFLERQEAYIRSAERAEKVVDPALRVIFPILWGPPRAEFPDAVKALQYTDDEFPAIYSEQGLQLLMNRSNLADDYAEFVRVLATRLVAAGRSHVMPRLETVLPIEEVRDAFKRPGLAASAPRAKGAGSSKWANFVFVAARSEELEGLKAGVEGYGGGAEWQPYWPDDEDPVFLMAQDAVNKLKLFIRELPLSGNLKQDLSDAERNNEIVMIIVDAWSIQLPQYSELIGMYDRITLLNCALLVPVNEAEPETAQKRDQLRDAMKEVFKYKTKVSQGIYFQNAIASAKDLRDGLLTTMSQIRLDRMNEQMAASSTSKQTVQSEVLERGAREKGIDVKQPAAVAVPTER